MNFSPARAKLTVRPKATNQVIALLLFGLIFSLSAPASMGQTPISCGQTVTNTLSAIGQRHAYVYSAMAGEVVTIRIAALSGGIDPYLELRDASRSLFAMTAGQIAHTIANAGNYLIIAYAQGNTDTGNYGLTLHRPKAMAAEMPQ